MKADNPMSDLFTSREVAECAGKLHSHARLAARLAVKEAFLKAAGIGLHSGLLFKDIEVINQVSGSQQLRISKRLCDLTGVTDTEACLVSSAFTDTLACAVVTLKGKGTE